MPANPDGLLPCPFQIGDEVTVKVDPAKPWSLDWGHPDESWFVEALRRTPAGYDITIADREDWQSEKFGKGTDGFEPADLILVHRSTP